MRRIWACRHGATAVLLVALLLSGCDEENREHSGSTEPSAPPPGGPRDTAALADPLVNGRIQAIRCRSTGAVCSSRYRSALRALRDRWFFSAFAFDQHTGRLLVTAVRRTGPPVVRLVVVGPRRQVANLPCHGHSATSRSVETFGPGPRELSVWGLPCGSGDGLVQVLGPGGIARRTIDLSAVLADGDAIVTGMDWSPDGARLAVTTMEAARIGESSASGHIWLVGRDGVDPQRVYTASHGRGTAPAAHISHVAWSPDGSRVGFTEMHAISSRPWSPRFQFISLLVPAAGEEGPGSQKTLYEFSLPPSDWRDSQYLLPEAFGTPEFLWAPDGTRVAVAVRSRVLELSAEDGGVLATHPGFREDGYPRGFVIWPARRP